MVSLHRHCGLEKLKQDGDYLLKGQRGRDFTADLATGEGTDMLLTKQLRILNWLLLLKLQSMRIPIEATAGMSARVKYTTEFVTLLDYDNVKDSRLVEELLYLQELHRLGDFYVFATNEFGRHVICVDRLILREELEVVNTSTCDAVFKRGIRINEYRTWILRVIGKGDRPKPRYLYSVESPYNGQHLQSQAHAEFLQRYYGAPVRLVKPDGNHELEIQGYKTASKTSTKDLK
jgi:hypothetical protein